MGSLHHSFSFDEVESIEVEAKEDHIGPEIGLQKKSLSKESFEKTNSDSFLLTDLVTNQMHQNTLVIASTSPNYKEVPINSEGHYSRSSEKAAGNVSTHTNKVQSPLHPKTSDNCDTSFKTEPFTLIGSDNSPSKEWNSSFLNNAATDCISEYEFEDLLELYNEGAEYHDDVADVTSNACGFVLSDTYEQREDLKFLEEANDQVRRDNLLEYGWGNTNSMEDMDKLLSNDSRPLRGYDESSDGILWESPSPTSPGRNYQSVDMPTCPKFIQNGDNKTKRKYLPCQAVPVFVKAEVDTGRVEQQCAFSYDQMQLISNVETSELQLNGKNSTEHGEEKIQEASKGPSWVEMEDEGASALKEASQEIKKREMSALEEENMLLSKEGKNCNKERRHGTRVQRFPECLRKRTSGSKLPLRFSSHAKKSSVSSMPSAQDLPLSGTAVPQLQNRCVQASPHGGFGFLSEHHMPVIVQGHPTVPQILKASQTPNMIGDSIITPDDKIEKLCRQKMQARLAVERQHQQLMHLMPDLAMQDKFLAHPSSNDVKECMTGSMNSKSQGAEPLVYNDVLSPRAVEDDGNGSSAAIMLLQLLNIASKMGMRTSLCLRDGFHRLAGNALQRGIASDIRGRKSSDSEPCNRCETSSSSDEACNERTMMVEDTPETQTNPVDRFIAHLLFYKYYPSLLSESLPSCEVSLVNAPTERHNFGGSEDPLTIETTPKKQIYTHGSCSSVMSGIHQDA